MRISLISVLIAVVLAACAGVQSRASFDKDLEKYNELVRWRELEQASFYASAPAAVKFKERAEAAKNARVIDYKIIDVKFDEKAREATAVILFSYYLLNTGQVSKVTDNQRWVYSEAGSDKGWRLASPLPEFR